jgi:hypothetical protein
MKIKFDNKQKVVVYNTEQHVMAPMVYDTHVIVEETEGIVDDVENPEIKIHNNNNNKSKVLLSNNQCEYKDEDDALITNRNVSLSKCNDEKNVVNHSNSSSNDIYIEYFKDYSNEYGLLYVLSNGIRCFLFNDNSLLLLYTTTPPTNNSPHHFIYNTYTSKTHTLTTSIHFTSISSLNHHTTHSIPINTLHLTTAITHLTNLPYHPLTPHYNAFLHIPYITKWKHTSHNTYIFILSTNIIECYCNNTTYITFHNDASTSLKYIKYRTSLHDVLTLQCGKTFTSFKCSDMNITKQINAMIHEILNS